MQHGSDLLDRYLARTRQSVRGFARKVGLPASQVCRFRQGRVPGLADAFLIEAGTKGRVPARSWVNGKPVRAPNGHRPASQ